MKNNLPLPECKKLQVTYRIEPGCLGPTGNDHIDAFCAYAEDGVIALDADFIHWHISPRREKSLEETSYSVNGKQLTHNMADKYLNVFKKNLDEFEEHLQEKLSEMIDSYWER